jgi:AcrR family transcriptional regulator
MSPSSRDTSLATGENGRTRRRRGPSKGDLKEQAILDTAWALLATKPVRSITVDELAAGARISRSTFYFYFDSRDAVVRALGARTMADLRSVGDPVPGGGSRGEQARAIIASLVARWRHSGSVLRAMDIVAENDPALREFWAGVSDPLVGVLAAAVEADRAAGVALPGPPDAHDLIRALVGMYWRAGRALSFTPPSTADDERLVDTLTSITMRAVYGTDDPARSD